MSLTYGLTRRGAILQPDENPGLALARRLKDLRVDSFDKPVTQIRGTGEFDLK